MTNQSSGVPTAETQHPHGPRVVHFKVQTPRGLWSLTEPKDATKRPEYPVTTKIEQVILDVRGVFKFVEQDSKYTLLRGAEILEPQRPRPSCKTEDRTRSIRPDHRGNACA